MNKLDYAEQVCNIINMKGYETIITDNTRNNGAYIGITVKTGKDDKVSPVFNIGDRETLIPEEFAERILSFIPAEVNVDAVGEIMQDKYAIMNRCHYILVNSEMNKTRESLLRRPVNRTLELQYKIDISDIVPGGQVPIETKHLDKLGLKEDEMFECSRLNTMEKYPARFVNISKVLPFTLEESEESIPMYVLTNTSNVYGAGAILYQGMKKLLEETVGDFVVIPSSVHETIIIPKYLGEINAITSMIQEVNSSVVGPEDVLSDRPYELVSDGVLLEV